MHQRATTRTFLAHRGLVKNAWQPSCFFEKINKITSWAYQVHVCVNFDANWTCLIQFMHQRATKRPFLARRGLFRNAWKAFCEKITKITLCAYSLYLGAWVRICMPIGLSHKTRIFSPWGVNKYTTAKKQLSLPAFLLYYVLILARYFFLIVFVQIHLLHDADRSFANPSHLSITCILLRA